MTKSPAWALAAHERATTPSFDTPEMKAERERERDRTMLNRRIRNRLEVPA